MNTKMTKKMYFEEIISMATELGRDDIVEFAKHEITLVSRVRTTPKQKENNGLIEQIYAEMEDGKPYTVTEMTNVLECCNGLSQPKINAMVRKMKLAGMVERHEDNKRNITFTKVAMEEGE